MGRKVRVADPQRSVSPPADGANQPEWRALSLDPAWEATFVPLDPPRASYFALWDPSPQQGLDLGRSEGGWKSREQVLVGPRLVATDESVAVLTIRQAIEMFARLPANAVTTGSVQVWAAVVRAALGLIARGKILPAVSPDGWDAWRVGPLDAGQLAHIDQLVAALPAIGHAVPLDAMLAGSGLHGEPELLTAEAAVAACLDAVADRLVRSPAAPRLVDSPLFAQLQPTRVPQLAAWTAEIGDRHCRASVLDILVLPPVRPDEVLPPVVDDHLGDHVDDPGRSVGEGSEAASPWRLNLGLRSLRDPSLRVTATAVWAGSVAPEAFGSRADIELTAALRDAAAICPELASVLDDFRPVEIELDDDAFDRFLESTDDLAGIGVEVRWSAELAAADLGRRLVVGTRTPAGSGAQIADFDSLVTVDWEFLLDGLALTRAELEMLSLSKRAMVPVRGRWVRLTSRSRRQLREPAPSIDLGTALRAARTGQLGGDLVADSADVLGTIPVRFAEGMADIARLLERLVEGRDQGEPDGLAATLRPYQRRGLAWMSDLADAGLGGCLADDMGLGKTVQVLALHRHRGRRTLVVCPTSLMANWAREAERFLPGVTVRRFHGPNRSLDDLTQHELVVTTYGVVRTDHDRLGGVEWDLVVADEAQHAKNPHSRTARSLRRIPGHTRLALTGTPVENRLTELWSIMDWVVPGLLGGLEGFRRNIALPIERDNHAERAYQLAELVRPFLLRRHKTDPGIAPDLPPKTELDVIVPLTAEQVSLYHATVSEILALVKGLDGPQRHGLVLKLLTGLKQITNHPAQYLGQDGPLTGRSGKLEALDDLVDQALLGGESVLVFSQYVAMGRLLESHLAARGVSVALLHGGLPPAARQELVDRLQAGRLQVLLLSLKAGGTGLNLTRATQVIHYDRWWNPAVEDQATDRAYRIGQDRPVTVHRLITEGTVEDRVAELLKQKRQLADLVVGGGESWISRLDDDDLAALVALDDGRVREGSTR